MASILQKNVVAKGDTSFISKSRFITSPDHLTTFNGGYIVPVLVKACEPNSQYMLDLASVIKMPTLLNEFYGKAWVDCYAFYATEELLMKKFEDFIGEGHDNSFSVDFFGKSGRNPNTQSGGSITPTLFKPRLTHHTEEHELEGKVVIAPHSLANYIGLPLGNFDLSKMFIDATPYRMYNMIYNCYFRSPFLMDPVLTDYGETDSEFDNYKLLKACKLPDYFTGYQTINPQLFDDIEIGLVGEVPVDADSRYANVTGDVSIIKDPDSPNFKLTYNQSPGSNEYVTIESTESIEPGGSTSAILYNHFSQSILPQQTYGYFGGLKANAHDFKADIGGINPYVDLSQAASVPLSAVRTAFVLQHISEKSLLGTDLKSLYSWAFGIKLNDFHLDRPLYVGGARIPLAVSSVSQTTPAFDDGENAITTPLGHEAGQSKTVGKNLSRVRFNSPMHGWLMVLIVVRQENVYEYGVDRMLCRKDRFDYYWREFIHAGNQKTFNYELYCDCDNMTEEQLYQAFGFAPYAEHIRRDLNRISGYFSSKATGSLNTYHLGSVFESLPHLEQDFIESDAEEVFDRLIAVESDKAHQFEGYFYFKFEKIIPVPTTTNPGLRIL